MLVLSRDRLLSLDVLGNTRNGWGKDDDLLLIVLVTYNCSHDKRGRQHWRTAYLVVPPEYRVLIPRVKTQILAFIGCTW